MSKCVYGIVITMFLMGLTGCTSQKLAGKSYLIPRTSGNQPQLAPVAIIKINKALWREWMVPFPYDIYQNNDLGKDLDSVITGFAKDLEALHFASVHNGKSAGRTFQISLSIEEINKGMKAGEMAGAMSLSCATLGVVTPKTVRVVWVCKMEMKAIRSDGVKKVYKAEVETIFAERENMPVIPQVITFMHENTVKCCLKLLSQVKADTNFWYAR